MLESQSADFVPGFLLVVADDALLHVSKMWSRIQPFHALPCLLELHALSSSISQLLRYYQKKFEHGLKIKTFVQKM